MYEFVVVVMGLVEVVHIFYWIWSLTGYIKVRIAAPRQLPPCVSLSASKDKDVQILHFLSAAAFQGHYLRCNGPQDPR